MEPELEPFWNHERAEHRRLPDVILRVSIYMLLLFSALCVSAAAQTTDRKTRVAVLSLGNTTTGRRAADQIARGFESERDEFQVVDRDQASAAALGIGYKSSLNMALPDARDLGSAIGCDFFFTGDAQTLRRSPSSAPIYFESYASIFLVSARTGRLILWEQRSFQAPKPEESEMALLGALAKEDTRHRWIVAVKSAIENEHNERINAIEIVAPVIEEAPVDGDTTANGLQLPRPYRRLKPPYTTDAAHAEVEAVVDVLVDIDALGEVSHVEVARWAGYGLDQAVIDTVKNLHFVPARRDGVAVPLRVLLRYNFRKPVQNRLR